MKAFYVGYLLFEAKCIHKWCTFCYFLTLVILILALCLSIFFPIIFLFNCLSRFRSFSHPALYRAWHSRWVPSGLRTILALSFPRALVIKYSEDSHNSLPHFEWVHWSGPTLNGQLEQFEDRKFLQELWKHLFHSLPRCEIHHSGNGTHKYFHSVLKAIINRTIRNVYFFQERKKIITCNFKLEGASDL